MNNNNMLVTGILVVIIAAGAFYGGMQYQKNQTRTAFAGMMNVGGQGGFGQGRGMMGGGGARGNRNGMAPVVGEVVSADANSVTVKLPDGSSKIVNISASTTISKTDTGSKADVKTGAKVAAFGTTNSDGSITAQNIQLNPMFRMRGMMGSGTPTPTQ